MTLMRTIRLWVLQNKVDIFLVVTLFVIAAIPRLWGLGLFLTADEKNWIGRAYEFIRAFKDFRFNDMLQTTHPGVTVLWSVGVAVISTVFVKHIPFSSQALHEFVWSSQFIVAFINALVVPVIYIFLRKLISGRVLPFFAGIFIALDPFIIGYSRVAHVDAVLMSFLVLTCLSILIWAKTHYSRRWLALSGVLFGLALLTKIPAIFALPYLLLTVLVFHAGSILKKQFFVSRSRDIVEWLLIAGLLFVIIWPAILFVPNPQGNVLVLKRDVLQAAETPHDMTEDYTLNPLHYPAALLARTTPLTLILSVVGIALLLTELVRRRSFFGDMDPRIMWLFVGYVFFFVFMMTLGAKKGDRYILPVWPMVDILAVMGLLGISQFFRRSYQVLVGSGVVVVLFLLITVISYHPYTLAYSNPLFPDNLSQELGWGEGLDQVAAWLNQNYPQAIVASWYPEELGAFTSARVVHINAHEQNQVQFVVLYKNMFGRAVDHPANDFIDQYYKKREPVFVAHVHGKEFAWVYEKKVYERVVGELTPDITVGQELFVTHPHLAAVEVFAATYSGKAVHGNFVVDLKDSLQGNTLYSWNVPVTSLKDATWTRFLLPSDLELQGKNVFVQIHTTGTAVGDAPTVRFAGTHDYIPGNFFLSRVSSLVSGDEKSGDLGVRLLYRTGLDLSGDDEAKQFQRFQ